LKQTGDAVARVVASTACFGAGVLPGPDGDVAVTGERRVCNGPSLQTNDTHNQTVKWVTESTDAGRPWFVCLDEIGPASTGVKPDKDDPTHDEVRKRHLWGNID
jgi:hypothetical protein